VRGQRVLLDSDLAALFGVTTKAFNHAVRRNVGRSPSDFLLQLTKDEANSLRSQTVTLKLGRGRHRKYLPMAFTEHGCLMLSSALCSARAARIARGFSVAHISTRLQQVRGSACRGREAMISSVDASPASESFRFTEYFDREVMRKRTYLRKDWCIRVLQAPARVERQEGDRWRFWASITELDGRYLRVVTLADKVTIHNAFPDRRFKP
jgi:hypothetical protein